MIIVLADIAINAGHRDAFLKEFRSIIPQVLAEDGCIEYGPNIDAETDIENQSCDATTVTIVEKWESVDALKAHLVAPHMLEYRGRVKDFVAGVKLRILEPA